MGWKIENVFMTDTGQWLDQEFWPDQIDKIIPKLQAFAEVKYSYALYTDVSRSAILDREGGYDGDIVVYAVPQASFLVQFDDRRGIKWRPSQVHDVCRVQDVIPTPVLKDVVSRKAKLSIRLSSPIQSSPFPQEIPICLHSELSSDTTIVITETR